MHGHHMYVYVYRSVQELKVLHNIYVYNESSLIWPDPFLMQGIYQLQYKQPAKALSMVVMLCSYLYVLNYLSDPQFHVVYVVFS